jgi:hypothetical protein
MKIRKSIVNPFLLNPIRALINDQCVRIVHCLSGNGGLIVGFDDSQNKYSTADLSEVEFANIHEFDRFKEMVSGLSKRKYLKAQDCLKYGFSIQ